MANKWVLGARTRTLPAAVVPVLVGTAVASAEGRVIAWRAAAALVCALAIQIGTNYANDYHDGIRGTDDVRVGPVRLVAAGLARPSQVRAAAFVAFAIAGVAGLALAAATTWWLLLVGACSFAAGWFYTGGRHPYGYAGYGEVFVFIFFGVVATVGSAFVHTEQVTALALLASIPVGALATALLVVNNLRDIPTDTAAGKRTLAVKIGDVWTRRLYLYLVANITVLGVLLVTGLRHWAILGLLALPFAVKPIRVVRSGAGGPALIPVLVATGRVQLIFGVVFALGIAV